MSMSRTWVKIVVEELSDATPERVDIDAKIVAERPCACGAQRHYFAFVSDGGYQAFAICHACDEVERL